EEFARPRTSPSARTGKARAVDARRVLPALRGALAELSGQPPERGPIVALRTSEAILRFLERDDARALVERGCATPDHVIRTKPTALLLEHDSLHEHARDRVRDAVRDRVRDAVREYARRYDAYFEAMVANKRVAVTKLDPWPRVVLVPGV